MGPKVDAIIGDQLWFAQASHGSFPDTAFARWVDFRAPQFYANDFTHEFGVERFAKVMAWGERDCEAHEAVMASKGIPARPRTDTFQGYGWNGIDDDLRAVIASAGTRPLIMWCEPWPDAQVLAALGAT